MRIKKDVLSGAAAVCIAVAFMFPSLRLGVASLTSDGVPGPGFFPFFVSLLVIGLGVAPVGSFVVEREVAPRPEIIGAAEVLSHPA